MIYPTENPIYISSFQSYKLYLIFANSFRKGYNPIKYSWKINVKESTFDKRKDKQFFERISSSLNIHEQQQLFMSNLLANPDNWIGDLINQDSIIFYRKYFSRFNDISILYREDLTNLILLCKKNNKPFKSLFEFQDKTNQMPIFQLLQKDQISYETFILLDQYFDIIEKLDQRNDFIWESFSIRVKAYKSFFIINKEESISILKEQLKLWK